MLPLTHGQTEYRRDNGDAQQGGDAMNTRANARATAKANTRFQRFFRRLLASSWTKAAVGAVLTFLLFVIVTYVPTPVSATAVGEVTSETLTPSGKWVKTQNQENGQVSLTLTVGQPKRDALGEFPGYTQQKSAIAGNAVCALTMSNMFGFTAVHDTIASDFLIDARGVSVANAQYFPSGGDFYSTTNLQESVAGAASAPQPSETLSAEVGIALGSQSGANVQNFVVYLEMTISGSGRVDCALESAPTAKVALAASGK